ncbi:hypothetical protein SE17_40935, partial [Kouleothrix aurantiaca]
AAIASGPTHSAQALLAHLRARNVVLDVSPSSNVCTGAVASIEAHPLPQLVAAGVPVPINTDDPTFFKTTLNDEYRLVASKFGFDADTIAQFVLNSVRATFLPEEERTALLASVEAGLEQLRVAHS